MQAAPGLRREISRRSICCWHGKRVQSLPRVAPRLLNQPRTSTRERPRVWLDMISQELDDAYGSDQVMRRTYRDRKRYATNSETVRERLVHPSAYLWFNTN